MKTTKDENGSVMVEAVIIFPIVLMAVMAMLYYGLFKLQEAAMLYQVQRVASEGSLMVSSPGYAELAGNGTKLGATSIDWDAFPSGKKLPPITKPITKISAYCIGKSWVVPGWTAEKWKRSETGCSIRSPSWQQEDSFSRRWKSKGTSGDPAWWRRFAMR